MEQVYLTSGLRELYTASKLLLVASILGVVLSIALLPVILAVIATSLFASTDRITGFIQVLSPLLTIVAILAIALVIIAIYAVYAKLLPASGYFVK